MCFSYRLRIRLVAVPPGQGEEDVRRLQLGAFRTSVVPVDQYRAIVGHEYVSWPDVVMAHHIWGRGIERLDDTARLLEYELEIVP